ncbi:interferon alpha-1/2-like [Enhydra lutris kenyoni]|uniref:Interferon alpha-1/2-like n=1 Tax=Enhydra lutris kenyoni TaxID=391180 RepID=A0A2Y9KPP3_ENHLU|nr:interferon alpha-1/2-like [Enhydra lutris kenyoni]
MHKRRCSEKIEPRVPDVPTPARTTASAGSLLQQMRRLPASPCDNYTNDFGFPQEAFDGKQLQKAQALSVVHVTNQKTFHLFCTEASPAPWNTTLLEELCSGIYQRVNDLEACLMQEAGVGETPLVNGDSILRNYFQRIYLYL